MCVCKMVGMNADYSARMNVAVSLSGSESKMKKNIIRKLGENEKTRIQKIPYTAISEMYFIHPIGTWNSCSVAI